MTKEIPSAYNAQEFEDFIYKNWEESGFFNPDNLKLDKDAPSYTIVLPPPNITAKLHLGHSAMLAIEDLLIRHKRMNGFRTLWIPGTDHAAIATQNVVEKRLLKKGITRHSLGREKFLEEVDMFLKDTQATILKQTRKMGASLDWSREAFTLDEQRKKAVQTMFINMYNEGVIERGERVVNWCPRCKSTLADDEVEHKDQTAPLYTFKYSKDFPFAIASTRPETKLGDTAVAVNPKDERYKDYIGKTYELDFCGVPLKIKIIADREIDPAFGTGALGVTPAHSMIDSKMAELNNLETIKVIDEDGNIHQGFANYSGLSAIEARALIVKNLEDNGLMEKIEEINNSLSICYRCDTAIEPLPSKQWFVNVNKKLTRLGNKSIKEKAIDAAVNKEINFVPKRFEKIYINWMENLHNWCISRQIWFGHRIPVWYRKTINNSHPPAVQRAGLIINNEVETYVGDTAPEGDGWVQDEDTLDTWFSSGMWTFSTLGWPDNYKDGVKSGDLARFTPTQVLETGFEIITLWVSRMIMMSFFALDEIPFSDVYLHGMILDDKGNKMSKSKGNGIDPLDVIEKFGTDAVRLSLLSGNTPGNNMRLSEEKIETNRNFVNKLWNIARYILSSINDLSDTRPIDTSRLSSADKWILDELSITTNKVSDFLNENYNFSLASDELLDFTKNKFADWYIEASKFQESSEKDLVLLHVLKTILKLWHPFIPFVTEKIWSEFNDTILMIESWPKIEEASSATLDFIILKNIITDIRNARAENKVEPSRKIKALIYASEKAELIKQNENLIKRMRTGIDELEVMAKGEKKENEIFISNNGIEIYLLGAIDKEKEANRIKKEIDNLKKIISLIEGKLGNEEFVKYAPQMIVDKEKEKLVKYKNELSNLQNI